MKKSKLVSLVLITAALAACDKLDAQNNSGASGDWGDNGTKNEKKVYMRSDTTAKYSRTHHSGIGTALLWYYAFRPYGGSGLGYRTGYYSGSIARSSNVGTNSVKSGIVRGGFGGRGFKASS